MNSQMIILTAIIAVLYGKAQCCDSDDAMDQYTNTIDCTNNKKCKEAVKQFCEVSALTTNQSTSIIDKEELKFSFKVSLMIGEHKILFYICFNHLSQESMHLQIYNFNKTIMQEFTPICQRYTDVMAHKYFLQHLLFNETKLYDATVIIQLTLVIIKLQVMANSLQTAQVCV